MAGDRPPARRGDYVLARIVAALTLAFVLAGLLIVGAMTGREPSIAIVLALLGGIGALLSVEALSRILDRGDPKP